MAPKKASKTAVYLAGSMIPTMVAYLAALIVVKMSQWKASKTTVYVVG